MRVCGTCHFGQGSASWPSPAAALVLTYSSTQLHGSSGIVCQIQNIAEQKPVNKASAYCSVCRSCTWLCRPEADINEACVDFLHMSRTSQQISQALTLMRQ